MCGISAPFTLCNRAATRTVSYFPHCVPYCENLLYWNKSESKSSSHRSLSARAARLLAGECARFLFRYFLLLLFLFCFLLLLLFLDGACVAFWCFFLPINPWKLCPRCQALMSAGQGVSASRFIRGTSFWLLTHTGKLTLTQKSTESQELLFFKEIKIYMFFFKFQKLNFAIFFARGPKNLLINFSCSREVVLDSFLYASGCTCYYEAD